MSSDKIDEEFTMARLHVSKLRSEVKNIVQRCAQLEAVQADSNRKLDDAARNLADGRLIIQQVTVWSSSPIIYMQ